MDKTINALGLMSGTSMDGVDATIIKSDGENINEGMSSWRKKFGYVPQNLYLLDDI